MNEHILIIDDDIDFQKTLFNVLKKEGYQVSGATDGQEAIELTKKNFYELIISDVRLPGMDGIETVAKIKKTQSEAKSLIIIMTGYSDEDAPIRAIRSGVDDFIRKPFKMEEFLHSVERNIKNCRLDEEKKLSIKTIKAINLKLIEKNEHISAILSSLAEGVFTVNENWKITHFNKAAEQITGFTEKEAMGMSCIDIFKTTLCREKCPLRTSMKSGNPVLSLEADIVNKSGNIIPIMVSASLVRGSEGEVMGGVEVFRDISEFKRMTEELKRSKEEIVQWNKELEFRVKERTKDLEQANKKILDTQGQLLQSAKMAAVGQLGAGVAHELNNPLGGILGYAQFILGKIENSNNGEDLKGCKEYIKHIETESLRCKAIIDNLLTFSQKPLYVKPEAVDIKKVIEDALFLLKSQLHLPNMKIVSQIDPDLPKVMGNANRYQQIFTNLIFNARQAMSDGGELKITAKKAEDKKTEGKEYVKIEVSDTGCGIAQEDLDKVFEAFFTTKQDKKSVGLGLFISYQIIDEYKGTITVKSEKGKGTTFTVLLPIESRKED
ncbi:MAG: response regulator [Candidatus Omnitrophica bacterium]|nr:response regulator [Candidatus Omnitrophota bacterium]